MSSRLLSIYLVNGVISGQIPSQRICAMRLPGGTAITGENGVGKTTSMSVLPLFFGATPSQLVQKSNNTKGMLDFMLPEVTSALIFEYSRGPNPEDVRMVVIRRGISAHGGAGGSVPGSYRFFKTGFREDLFVKHTHVGSTFMDDEQSKQIANALKINTSAKMDAAAYRSIIQKVKAISKTGDLNIPELTSQYSFAHIPLKHIDRVMTSIIKEKVEFRDLIDICTSIVTEGLSTGSGGSDKFQLNDMHKFTGDWISDRRACEAAEKQKSQVENLREHIQLSATNLAQLHALGSDIRQLFDQRKDKLEKQKDALEELDVARSSQLRYEEIEALDISDVLTEIQEELRKINLEYVSLSQNKESLINKNAEECAQRVTELPSVLQKIQQLRDSLQLLEGKSQDLANKLDRELNKIEAQKQQMLAQFAAQKNEPLMVFNEEVGQLHVEQANQLEQLHHVRHTEVAEEQEIIDRLRLEIQALKTQISISHDDPQDVQRIEEATSVLDKISKEMDSSVAKERNLADELSRYSVDFQNAQRLTQGALEQVKRCEKDYEDASLAMSPEEGSLLAVLRKQAQDSGDDSWERLLARVVNPQLMTRKDLNPKMAEDFNQQMTAYGWTLDTTKIDTPDWANSTLMAEILMQKQKAKVDAQVYADDCAKAEVGAGVQRKKAEDKHSKALGELNTLRNKKEQQSLMLQTLRQKQQTDRQTRKDKLRSEMSVIEAQERVHALRKQDMEVSFGVKSANLSKQFETHKRDAKARYENAVVAIDQQIATYVAEQEKAKASLKASVEQAIRDSGIDPEHLQAMRAEIEAAEFKRDDLQAKQTYADSWNKWQKEGGEQKLIAAKSNFENISLDLARQENKQAEQKAQAKASEKKYEEQARDIKKLQTALENDIQVFELLIQQMQEFIVPQNGPLTIDHSVSVDEIKSQVSGLLSKRTDIINKISEITRSIERALTKDTSNSVAALITKSMVDSSIYSDSEEEQTNEIQKAMRRADALLEAYEKIGLQVTNLLHSRLWNFFEMLQSYVNKIHTVNSAISSFNRKFQAGISTVASNFSRLKDFNIEITSSLKAKELNDSMEELRPWFNKYRSNAHMNVANTEVPDASIDRHLQSLTSSVNNGSFDLDVSRYITVSGSCVDNGIIKPFKNERDLAKLSSTGITALAMVTMLCGILNIQRGSHDIYLPWASDEVGKFDGPNLAAMINMLGENKIDVMTASPQLSATAYSYFAQRYLVKPGSIWAVYGGSNTQQLELVNKMRESNDDLRARREDQKTTQTA